jgi:hypothetical protein
LPLLLEGVVGVAWRFLKLRFVAIHPTHGAIFIHQGGIALGLFGGDIPEPNTVGGKEDGGTREQKDPKLQNGIQSPGVKKQNTATEKGNSGKKNIVVSGEVRSKRSQKVQPYPGKSQENAH